MIKGSRRPSLRVMVLWLVAALFVGVFAACSQASDAGIPTASDSQAAPTAEANSASAATTASATTPEVQDAQDTALAFSQCMRENGLPEFTDPDSEGRILLKLGTIDPNSEEFKKAGEACRHQAPEGWGDEEAGPGDAEVMLEFARCMRENGLPDYPDPDPNAGLQIFGPDSGVDPNDPAVQAALESCKAILEGLQNGPRIGG